VWRVEGASGEKQSHSLSSKKFELFFFAGCLCRGSSDGAATKVSLLGSVPRSAHVAWSPASLPSPKQQYLVAGTAAGTLSADFDTSASLELLPVALHGGAAPGGVIGQPLGRVQAPARFTGECKS